MIYKDESNNPKWCNCIRGLLEIISGLLSILSLGYLATDIVFNWMFHNLER